MSVRRFKVDKLIRDRLPEIMRAQGLTTYERRLGDDEYRAALRTKLVEEAREAEAAADREELLTELGDVLEVVLALAAAHGLKPEDVETERLRKRAVRGGFEDRVYNAAVEAYDHCAALKYYTEKPEQYPEEVIPDAEPIAAPVAEMLSQSVAGVIEEPVPEVFEEQIASEADEVEEPSTILPLDGEGGSHAEACETDGVERASYESSEPPPPQSSLRDDSSPIEGEQEVELQDAPRGVTAPGWSR